MATAFTAERGSADDLGVLGPRRQRLFDGLLRRMHLNVGRPQAFLMGGDMALCAVVAVVNIALAHGRSERTLGWLLAPLSLTILTTGCVRACGLWDHRISRPRTVEASRLIRASGLAIAATFVVDHFSTLTFRAERVIAVAAGMFVAGVLWRSLYRHWLTSRRAKGDFRRRAMIVGTNQRATNLINLINTYPENGIEVVAVVGSEPEAELAGLGPLWVGGYNRAEEFAGLVEPDLLVVCSGICTDLANRLMRTPIGECELYLDPGLSGVDAGRLRASPIAHEPVLYVIGGRLSRLQSNLKRVADVVGAVAALCVLSPLLAVVALAVRRQDGGPALFTQKRVGQNGVEFKMYKFRTMVVDAEAKLAALAAAGTNQRTGPLYKNDADPRVTRLGKLLRATSIDELPQLLNVVKGEMSLVGPRPAKAEEVALFPEDLRGRHQVKPGITGLWQLEARDNPHFDAYRQLDLFYVENWSLGLDAILVVGTVLQMALRPFAILGRRSEAESPTDDVAAVSVDTESVPSELDPIRSGRAVIEERRLTTGADSSAHHGLDVSLLSA